MNIFMQRESTRPYVPMVLTVLIVLVFAAGCYPPAPLPSPTARPTPTPEPLVPTPRAQTIRTPMPVRPSRLTPVPLDEAPPDRWRFGVSVAVGKITDYDLNLLLPGWYLNWWATNPPLQVPGIEYAPMVHLKEDGFHPALEDVLAIVDAMPGALWLLGNEPDVRWQDNMTPEAYARRYHTLYTLIKERDPTARIAIAGVSQPTALRLRYLDRVLEAYETLYGTPMPVDVWNVHGFILREEADSWGVGIPPGFDDRHGELYEIEDHDDLEIFQRQIIGFRYWMWMRGQRDKPLIVSEYGILMPPDYGFPPQAVRDFMLGTFDFFMNARDEELGYPADDDRLVQRWCWFSLGDTRYPTSNLFDPETRAITPLGEAFGEYVRKLDEGR